MLTSCSDQRTQKNDSWLEPRQMFKTEQVICLGEPSSACSYTWIQPHSWQILPYHLLSTYIVCSMWTSISLISQGYCIWKSHRGWILCQAINVLHYFSHSCDKTFSRNNLKTEGFILVHGSRGFSPSGQWWGWESRRQEHPEEVLCSDL